MFTWRHLLWLAICAGLVWAAVHAFNKKRPGLDRVLTTALIVAVISEIVKMAGVIELVPSKNGELLMPYLPMNHLPLHFCSLQIILIAAAKFMKDDRRRETLLAFMAPTCVYGGILALLMPSIFTTTIPVEEAFKSPVAYQFFFFHTMIIALGLIIVRSDSIDWSRKHFRDTTLIIYLCGFISIYLNSMLASPTYADGKLVKDEVELTIADFDEDTFVYDGESLTSAQKTFENIEAGTYKVVETNYTIEGYRFESEQSVYKWLRGDSLPKVDNLFALARLFGTPMEDILMEREGEDESPLLPRLSNNSIQLYKLFLTIY